ncbi:MAG TPA: electron transfer flavoprotein subunit alpha/FixB family protein [Chloroflexota bacterium]|nr:electron transfer flavoprotein subunit alpha/FixB family protein [Chloroflexota bacterium]
MTSATPPTVVVRGPAYPPHEAAGIWVWVEQHDGVVEDVSRELLGKGRDLASRLAQPLVAVVLGAPQHAGVGAADAAALGADEVLVVGHAALAHYATDPYTDALDQLVRRRKPAILLLGATPDGRDLAGRLAVRLYTGLTADCTDLTIGPSGLLESHVVGFGGGIAAIITCQRHAPQMATVRPGVFPQPAATVRSNASERIRPASVDLDSAAERVRVLERQVHAEAGLTRAPVVVIGGAGTRGDFHLLEALAETLDGEVGATRVAVDQGWIGRDRQIGQTGVVVRPKVAIACGVSGASQLTVGISGADTVIAINSDAGAPLFDAADYGVVGDLFRVLPPLLAELRTDQPKAVTAERRPA